MDISCPHCKSYCATVMEFTTPKEAKEVDPKEMENWPDDMKQQVGIVQDAICLRIRRN